LGRNATGLKKDSRVALVRGNPAFLLLAGENQLQKEVRYEMDKIFASEQFFSMGHTSFNAPCRNVGYGEL